MLKRPIDHFVPCRRATDANGQPEGEIIPDRQMRKQKRVLKQNSHTPPFRRQRQKVGPIKAHTAANVEPMRQMTADRVQKGRFADARRTHQCRNRSGGHAECQRWKKRGFLAEADRKLIEVETHAPAFP
jgi:hypothetical protein